MRRNIAEASTLGKLVTWPRDGGMWACNCCRGRCNNLSEVGSSRQRQQQQQQQQQSEQLESGDKNLKENYENCAQLTQFPLHFSTTCNYFFLGGTASYSCLSPTLAQGSCCRDCRGCRCCRFCQFVPCNHAIMLPTSELLMPIGVNVRTSSAFALRRNRPDEGKENLEVERGRVGRR